MTGDEQNRIRIDLEKRVLDSKSVQRVFHSEDNNVSLAVAKEFLVVLYLIVDRLTRIAQATEFRIKYPEDLEPEDVLFLRGLRKGL